MLFSAVSRGVAVLAAASFLATASTAAPVAPKDEKKEETAAQKLRKELDVAVTIEIPESPLPQAITQLRQNTKLNIVLDRGTILMMGYDPSEIAVSLQVKQVKLRSALRTMLSQCNLTFAIVGDSIVVTTEDQATYRQLKQRVTVELDKVPLEKALKQLSKETATNLLLDNKVTKEGQAPITLDLDDVPLETALRLMSEMAGLKAVRVGNVILVTSKTSADALRGEPELVPSTGGANGGVIPIPPGGGPGMGFPLLPPGIGGGAAPAVPELPPMKEKEERRDNEKKDDGGR